MLKIKQYKFAGLLMMFMQVCFCVANAQDVSKRLDSLFNSYYPNNLPGAAVAVFSKGKIIFSKGYGLADLSSKKPITTTTNFNIGSLTKQFTAYSVIHLCKQKNISLQQKLPSILNGFNKGPVSDITVKQMLSHNSGIMDHYSFTDTAIVKHATDVDVYDAVKGVNTTYFTPGTQFRYSNTAYCLLAMMIEKWSGMSYRDYVNQQIITPLHMRGSQILKVGSTIANRAYGYEADSSGTFHELDLQQSIFFSTEGDGGMYTSINDYQSWLTANFNHELDTGAMNACWTPQFTIDSAKGLSYGFGWFIRGSGDSKTISHTGSNGGFRAIVFIIPSTKYAVVIFSNRTGINQEDLVEQINAITGEGWNLFTKIESLTSFQRSWPIFAPCKKIPSFSTSLKKNWNASDMASN